MGCGLGAECVFAPWNIGLLCHFQDAIFQESWHLCHWNIHTRTLRQ